MKGLMSLAVGSETEENAGIRTSQVQFFDYRNIDFEDYWSLKVNFIEMLAGAFFFLLFQNAQKIIDLNAVLQEKEKEIQRKEAV